MDINPELLKRIEVLCIEIQEASERYKKATNENQVFEVRRKILADIRELEQELDKLRVQAKTPKS